MKSFSVPTTQVKANELNFAVVLFISQILVFSFNV